MPRLLDMDFDTAAPPPFAYANPQHLPGGPAAPVPDYVRAGRMLAERWRQRQQAKAAKAAKAELIDPNRIWFEPKKAAVYLDISYSMFRKIATQIPCHEVTRNYHRDVLDNFKRTRRPDKKRARPKPKK